MKDRWSDYRRITRTRRAALVVIALDYGAYITATIGDALGRPFHAVSRRLYSAWHRRVTP